MSLALSYRRVADIVLASLGSYFYVLGLTVVFLISPGGWRRKYRLTHPGLATSQLALESPAA